MASGDVEKLAQAYDRVNARRRCYACQERPLIERGASGKRVLIHHCPVLKTRWVSAFRGPSALKRTVDGWNRVQVERRALARLRQGDNDA